MSTSQCSPRGFEVSHSRVHSQAGLPNPHRSMFMQGLKSQCISNQSCIVQAVEVAPHHSHQSKTDRVDR